MSSINTAFKVCERTWLNRLSRVGISASICGAIAFGPIAMAQGPDCSTAEQITGTGIFILGGSSGSSGWPFSTIACSSSNGLTVDGYYQWYAPANGDYLFNFDVPSSYRAVLLYSGLACQATYVTCFSTSHSDWNQNMNVANLQVGDPLLFRGVGLSVGGFEARHVGIPCGELAPDNFVGNNNGCSSAAPIGNGFYPSLVAEGANPDYYSVCVAAGDVLDVDATPGVYGELSVRLSHAGNGCSGFITGRTSYLPFQVSYQNTTDIDQQIAIRVFPSYSGKCLPYDLLIAGAGGCGAPSSTSTFCDPMDPNSTGVPTTVTAITGTGIASGIRLEAQQGPPGQFASFIVGTGVVQPGLALGQGRFCLAIDSGHQIGRYNVSNTSMNSIGRFDSAGVFENLAGTSQSGLGFDVPIQVPSINQFIRVGESWHFQMWNRDVNGQSNFSNGVSVTYGDLP